MAAAGILSLAPGCDTPPPPAVEIAGIGVPEEVIAPLGPADRQTFADLLAVGASIAREEAEELGRPLIERAALDARVAALPYSLAATSMGWTEEDIRAAYAEQPEWELVVRHVVLLADEGDPPARHEAAREVASEVAARAAAGEDFAALAAGFSEEPGAAERGGLLEPGRRGSWVEEFWNAANALAPGQVSGVVRSTYGYHVIRLEERRAVPFEEASRTRLLQRVVPGALATTALEEWMSVGGVIAIDSAAARDGRSHILGGTAVPEGLVIAARESGNEVYSGADLAAGWGLLDPRSRAPLEADEPAAFLDWVIGDARTVVWGEVAESEGLDTPAEAMADARTAWFLRVGGWAGALGFRPGMMNEQVLAAAREAVLSGTPEARAARIEIRSLRPRLREVYPPTGDL